MQTIWNIALVQLRMYVRDRQSMVFAFIFPLIFMLALGYMVGNGEVDPIDVSVVPPAAETTSPFTNALKENELLVVHEEDEAAARSALQNNERDLILFAPAESAFEESASGIPMQVLVNASEPQQTTQALAILQGVLVDVERQLRDTEAMFAIQVEDVEARNARYVDFLVPGLLAFMIMQLSIAGSGFNIVEYKRKGILKRLFVTPLLPFQFIVGLIASRLVIVLLQISLLLLVAKLVFDLNIIGSMLLLYLFALLGSILFLGLGFALGGIAKTQSAVMAVGNLFIFPQMFLAGIFFPLDSLPGWLQPVASVLPLNFVSDALRQIANDGAGIAALTTDIIGIAVWMAIGIFLAVWLFRWSEAANV